MRLVLAWSGFFLAVARADLVAEHSALSDEFIAGKWFLYVPGTLCTYNNTHRDFYTSLTQKYLSETNRLANGLWTAERTFHPETSHNYLRGLMGSLNKTR